MPDINAEIDRELAIAKARWGETFELKCLEGSHGDTLSDDDLLRMLRYLRDHARSTRTCWRCVTICPTTTICRNRQPTGLRRAGLARGQSNNKKQARRPREGRRARQRPFWTMCFAKDSAVN
jgi:hypothetical protein